MLVSALRDTKSRRSALLRHCIYFYHSIIISLSDIHSISFPRTTAKKPSSSFTTAYSGIILSPSWKWHSHCCRKWEQQRSIDSVCYLMSLESGLEHVFLHDIYGNVALWASEFGTESVIELSSITLLHFLLSLQLMLWNMINHNSSGPTEPIKH